MGSVSKKPGSHPSIIKLVTVNIVWRESRDILIGAEQRNQHVHAAAPAKTANKPLPLLKQSFFRPRRARRCRASLCQTRLKAAFELLTGAAARHDGPRGRRRFDGKNTGRPGHFPQRISSRPKELFDGH